MANTILMTGATGLLGRYLLKDILTSETALSVVVRPNRRSSARQRVDAIIGTWEQELGRELPRPRVLAGDITAPCLGLSDEDIQWVKDHCDLVLHNAASLTFQTTDSEEEPWRTNVGGTRHVLDLCEQTEIRDFHHVSTAYICGLRSGVVRECELDEGQKFGNAYERSKIEAEQMVQNAPFLSPPTVYRPSIIIGDSETGFTSTFHGFYAFLRLTYTLLNSEDITSEKSDRAVYPARITLDGNECKNFVPVDWVSAVISHILRDRRHHGQTYHLTADQPVTVQTVVDVLEAAIGYTGTVLHGADQPIDNPNLLEELFYKNMQVYDAYWRHDPVFDKTNTNKAAPTLRCPAVNFDLLTRLSRTAIDMGFRWKDRLQSTTSTQAAGVSLQPE